MSQQPPDEQACGAYRSEPRTDADRLSGIDPTGVPRPGEGRAVAILLVGAVLAFLALITTLGWAVYSRM